MENIKPKTEEELRIERVKASVKQDKDGYCGCPKCGSYKLLHDGGSLDNGYIVCLECKYEGISGSDPYELIEEWNNLDRSGNL